MLVQAHIQKWGNSMALRITGPVRAIPNFKAGMEFVMLDFEPTKGKRSASIDPSASTLIATH